MVWSTGIHLNPQDRDPAFTELWLSSLGTVPGAESLEPLPPGTVLDQKYRIQRQIGRGGQGAAYLASLESGERSRNRSVVLKEYVLPRHAGFQVLNDAISRFQSESGMLQKIHHPNIVDLEDYFVEDSRAYMVFEHVNGQNLKDFVRENGAMDSTRLIEIATRLSSILRYLHEEAAVIHHDFTPDNLIISESGEVKLIDFSSARETNSSTTEDSVSGKHAYMPPERFSGESDTGSDLYALGCTLSFLASGKDPEALTQSDLKMHIPEVEAALRDLVLKLTAQEKTQRCLSLDEVDEMLARARNSVSHDEASKIDLSVQREKEPVANDESKA